MRVPLLAGMVAACSAASACVSSDERDPGTVLHDTPPTITGIQYSCSVDEEKWIFQVTTDAWTANGTLYLAATSDYVEQHSLQSEEAAADGSSDLLTLSLSIVADWRDVSASSSTAFLCNSTTEAAICWRIFVYTPGTGDVSDCASGGYEPTWFDDMDDIPTCDTRWETDSGGP